MICFHLFNKHFFSKAVCHRDEMKKTKISAPKVPAQQGDRPIRGRVATWHVPQWGSALRCERAPGSPSVWQTVGSRGARI